MGALPALGRLSRRAAAGGEQVGRLLVVRVGGEAAVLRRRPDGEHARGGARIQGLGLALPVGGVSRRRDHQRPELSRLTGRVAHGRHVGATIDRVVELQRDVDHVGTVLRRPQDPGSDVACAADPVAVEHPNRHQRCPVGDPGQEVVAVRGRPQCHLLADRACDVGTVAVLVERQLVAVDQIVAADELARVEVG